MSKQYSPTQGGLAAIVDSTVGNVPPSFQWTRRRSNAVRVRLEITSGIQQTDLQRRQAQLVITPSGVDPATAAFSGMRTAIGFMLPDSASSSQVVLDDVVLPEGRADFYLVHFQGPNVVNICTLSVEEAV